MLYVNDVGKRRKHRHINHKMYFNNGAISTIHLIEASRDLTTLRIFITNQQYDRLVTCYDATSLHFVVASSGPSLSTFDCNSTHIFHRAIKMEDFGEMITYENFKAKGTTIILDERREACISILMQARIDVWKKINDGKFSKLGRPASSANHLS